MSYDDLLERLDEMAGGEEESFPPGLDPGTTDTTPRIRNYVGVPQRNTDVPTHIEFSETRSLSLIIRDPITDDPIYYYSNALRFMIVDSLTTKSHGRLVGGRKLPIPMNDMPGAEGSIFPFAHQKGNGYGQACLSLNGVFPLPQFEGEEIRDYRTGIIHRIGRSTVVDERGAVLQKDVPTGADNICSSCPFADWIPRGHRVILGGRGPLCRRCWTWIIYIFPGQEGTTVTDKDKKDKDIVLDCEIPSGLYRITGHNPSIQAALFGVREGKWGCAENGSAIVGLTELTRIVGSTITQVPFEQNLSVLQKRFLHSVVDDEGNEVETDVATAKPDKHFWQLASPSTNQFPEGKPEIVGMETVAYPLVVMVKTNNAKKLAETKGKKVNEIYVPVSKIDRDNPLTPDEYGEYLMAWVGYMKENQAEMAALNPGDYVASQQRNQAMELPPGQQVEQPQLPGLSESSEAEDISFD